MRMVLATFGILLTHSTRLEKCQQYRTHKIKVADDSQPRQQVSIFRPCCTGGGGSQGLNFYMSMPIMVPVVWGQEFHRSYFLSHAMLKGNQRRLRFSNAQREIEVFFICG
jgi:hypothetical protein